MSLQVRLGQFVGRMAREFNLLKDSLGRNAALQPWHMALANQRSAPAKVVFLGDSVMEGAASTNILNRAQAVFTRSLRSTPGGDGYLPAYVMSPFVANIATYSNVPIDEREPGEPDVQYSDTLSWGLAGRRIGLQRQGWIEWSFYGDRVTVFYNRTTWFGINGRVMIDGVQQVVLEGGGADVSWESWTSGVLPRGQHTIRIQEHDNLGGSFWVEAVQAFDGDHGSGVHSFDGARSGGRAEDWTGANAKWTSALQSISPSLVVVPFGFNDVTVRTPAQFKADVQGVVTKIVQTLPARSFSIAIVGFWSPDPAPAAGWAAYMKVLEEVAAGEPSAVFVRIGDRWPKMVAGVDNSGMFGTDTVHPNSDGQQLLGRYLADALGLHGDSTWKAAPSGGGGTTDTTTVYAPATTSSNDTSALLAAMQAAKDSGKAFRAAPDTVYNIDPLTAPTGLRIDGALRVRGRTAGQSHVLRLSGAAHELSGSSLIVDANSAVDGLQLFNAGRSRFGYVDARYAVRNGVHLMQTDGTVTTPNNNNQCSFGHVVVAQNGRKHTTSATVASQTGNANLINSGFTTLTLSTALPSWSPDVQVVDSGNETVLSSYLVIIAGKAYRVKGVKTTTRIEVYNYPATSAGTTLTVDVLLGAGFNSPMFRDNQAGYIANLDAISNPAIGLNAGSAYGWTYSKSAYQGCGVGVNVQNFTQGANWIGPYFELNTVDMVIGTNADATITSPQWAEHKLQALWDRLSSRGEGYHPGLKVIGSTSGAGGRVGPLSTNEPPTMNNGTLTLSPGYSYAFQRSAGNPAFRIAPNKNMTLYGAYMFDIALECTGAWSGTVSFTILTGGDYYSDTVMGASSYVTPTLSAGTHFFRVFRVGTDWRVARVS